MRQSELELELIVGEVSGQSVGPTLSPVVRVELVSRMADAILALMDAHCEGTDTIAAQQQEECDG
jgi:hypothetical protein